MKLEGWMPPVHPCITSLGPALLLQTPSAHDVGPVPAVPEVEARLASESNRAQSSDIQS